MTRTNALVVGSTGISGSNLADLLLEKGWTVHGLARAPSSSGGVKPVAADLLDIASVRRGVAGLDISHVFFCTWSRQPNEVENCRVNGLMLRNLLDAVGTSSKLDHVALVTGLKHYLGPFESYGQVKPDTPFSEDQGRLPFRNFYYEQEDILFETAARGRLQMVSAPASHADRLGARQRHEYGRHPGGLRRHLQGKPDVPSSSPARPSNMRP